MRLKLRALKPRDTSSFFPSRGLRELSPAYVITGGVPYYLSRLARYRTFDEALNAEFFTPGGALLPEHYLLLYPEVRNVDSYMALLSLIAEGVSRTSKLSDKAGISQALCSSMLRKLENLSIVSEKRNAVINTKAQGWEIEDNFLAFWFRFIYPARTAVELDNTSPFLIETPGGLDEFTGKRIEEAIRQYIVTTSSVLIRDYGFLEFANPVERKNEETDLVALTSGGEYIFGEFKWRERKTAMGELENLRRKAVPAASGKPAGGYYPVSLSGLSTDLMETAVKDNKIHLIEGKVIFGLRD